MSGTPRASTRPHARALGLTGRVFLVTASIVAAVIVAAFVITAASVRREGEAAARRGLEQSAELVAQFLAGRSRSLAGGARVFVQGPYFRTLVAGRRSDDILDQAFEAKEQLDADWVFITDDRGVLLAKSDEPGASGTAMGAVPLVAGALRGQVTSGFGVARDSSLFQAVAVPIVTPGGAPIGALVATRLVDSLLVRDVKATTSSELLFFVASPSGRRRVTISTLGRSAEVARALSLIPERDERSPASHPDVSVMGVPYLAQGSALITAGGDVVGGFVVLRSREAELTGIASLRRSLAVSGLLGLLLSWFAAFIAAQRIARPARDLAGIVHRAAEGEYPREGDDAGQRRGAGREFEELHAAFSSLIADLRDKDRLTGLQPAPIPTGRQAVTATLLPRGASRLTAGGTASPRGRFVARAGLTFEPGAVLANRYTVESVLGSGGLGIVYRVHDRVIGEAVALKVLRPEILVADANAATGFADELRVARRVSHRNVVRVHDLGSAEGVTFLTMECVDGPSLATVIETRGALDSPAVVAIARQLMRALIVMHAEGIVHGDLKPANLLLGPNGVLKVADFGIARVMRRRAMPDDVASDASHARDTVGHLSGAVVGTPEYMAPEQLIGGTATPASDIYAAGVILHECLRGTTPFNAESRVTFLAHKLDPASVAPKPARAVGADASIEAIVVHMMSPQADARPASAALVFDALAALG